MERMFEPLVLKRITLPHRIIRAATYENMASEDGAVSDKTCALYSDLAEGGVGTIITGFSYFCREGRAAQPFQAGIDSDSNIDAWKRVIEKVKAVNPGVKIFIQIAHTGRQTVSHSTGCRVVGAGPVRCDYFLSKVHALSEKEVMQRIEGFVQAVIRAEKAGFDGVQIHSAHGYLIHQFLSPYTNRRKDAYGKDRTLFLSEIIDRVRKRTEFPVFLKLSASEDRKSGIQLPLMKSYMKRINELSVDAVEISYGTMEFAFNIIRGEHPIDVVLKHNWLFNRWGEMYKHFFRLVIYPWYRKHFINFSEMYNLNNAIEIKSVSEVPVFVTGGIRKKSQIRSIIESKGLDGVTLCRPFIREPDFVNRLRKSDEYISSCTNCNLCTVMSDSKNPLRCYSAGNTRSSSGISAQ
ncbi:MAG: NADH:flavin oxidoreductase [Candidatus Riflebacteria bacterium]|nr:NADH:flavin oxidoreductase [Candidatus Riflebacteria bacterium]